MKEQDREGTSPALCPIKQKSNPSARFQNKGQERETCGGCGLQGQRGQPRCGGQEG